MPDSPSHLFVYGTLRSDAGGEMHQRLMRGVRFAGRASIGGRMYHAGWHPSAVPSADPAERVRGELYAIDPGAARALLATLDEYEGYDAAHPASSPFVRHAVEAVREDGTRATTWVYFCNGPVDGLPRITSGDWIGG
ncbi:MAG TPA: gamma-glutamylcyclotransferase family protein [Longimicrobium sp.]|nr:gamma-glutamylcyclotransferase family protein [Longimicrobium sp.]